MLNELYNVDTQTFRQNFWMINTSNCCTIESIRSDIIMLSLLFLMLYCNMINVRCVLITFRFACSSLSWYLRFVVSNVLAIFFQKSISQNCQCVINFLIADYLQNADVTSTCSERERCCFWSLWWWLFV